MMKYHWPGNIRELEHIIERAVLLTKGDTIKDIPLPETNRRENILFVDNGDIKTIEENERDHILAVLKKCKGKVFGQGGAAELLGINVSTLNSKIKKLGIKKEKFFE
jgi:DNA-binding NtrC family response regulator